MMLKDLVLNAVEANDAVSGGYPDKGAVVLYDAGYKGLGQAILGGNRAHRLRPGAGGPIAYHKQQQPKGGGALWIGLAEVHAAKC